MSVLISSHPALECLRGHRSRLSYLCREEIFGRDQLTMVDGQSDFKLMDACAEMIRSYCQSAALTSSPTLLDCLQRASMREGDLFDSVCRDVVQKRLVTQRLDSRLNPRLTSNCRFDIKNYCRDELIEDKNTPFETGNGLLTSINLDVRMDPLLVEVCHADLVTHCSEEVAFSNGDDLKSADGAALECLRRQVALNKVKNDSCALEVLQLTIASKTDIDVDPILVRHCIEALEANCAFTGRSSGRLLNCLLDTLDSSDYFLERSCKESLELRKELWQMASKRLDWRSLIKEVRQTYSLGLIVGIALAFIGAIFITCLCCGRCTKRTVHVKDR
ncbi:hypothetical protein ACTXT7_006241 [Hymenolepis weldensis]